MMGLSGMEMGALMFALLLVMLAFSHPHWYCDALDGSIGYTVVAGIDPLLNYFKGAAYARYSVYDLSVVPLFLLMGQFATHGGVV